MPGAEPFFLPAGDPACLLVHGFTSTPQEMRLLGEHLAGQGFTSLGIRLRGHATQPSDLERVRWQACPRNKVEGNWLLDLEDGWHLLDGSHRPVVVIGLSMGGALALTFATQFPVKAVIGLAVPAHLPSHPQLRWLDWIHFFKPTIQKGSPIWYDQEALKQRLTYPVEPTRAVIKLRRLLAHMLTVLPGVQAPALLVYSRDDPTIRATEGHLEQIYSVLGSRQKEYLWLEKSGHALTRDLQREHVFNACSEFIRKVVQP